jgi:hypothetical protein
VFPVRPTVAARGTMKKGPRAESALVGWLREQGFPYAKRRGKGNPGDWFVITDVATFAGLIR